ncbi:hypothetical protein IFM89_015547 [Coptis chinensis]|uniref:ADF-H domain-containing protein n=1 Tax=Coptis chinensis TaxID=261450 RepID=A0A835I3A7_9MAGN|nr:hypothetical protein IFM89_015547 [Coptis chinensis]
MIGNREDDNGYFFNWETAKRLEFVLLLMQDFDPIRLTEGEKKLDLRKREVVVEKTVDPAENDEDFAASLPENDCRYAVCDFNFVTSENCQKSKVFFISWRKTREKSEVIGVMEEVESGISM